MLPETQHLFCLALKNEIRLFLFIFNVEMYHCRRSVSDLNFLFMFDRKRQRVRWNNFTECLVPLPS